MDKKDIISCIDENISDLITEVSHRIWEYAELSLKEKKSAALYVEKLKELGFEVVASYGLKLRPMEANILHKIEGEDIFLYDTENGKKAPKGKPGKLEAYFYPGMNRGKMTRLVKRRLSGN